MRLGLLADIHEAVEPLKAAVHELRVRRVDAYVMLGDLLEDGSRIDEAVAVLAPLPGAGVWGNHDMGLCGEVHESARRLVSAGTVEYFASLQPWLEIEGHRFQHVDAHLDPSKFEDLWTFPSVEERVAGLARSPHRSVFAGHLHLWAVTTPTGYEAWRGASPFRYRNDERYLTIVGAVCDGCCAVLDTRLNVLEPIRVT